MNKSKDSMSDSQFVKKISQILKLETSDEVPI